MMQSEQWIFPFKGRNYSGATYQNFLWKDNNKNIYIMDNHRSALWCWLQEIDLKQKIKYFHLDRHYDCLHTDIKEWIKVCPDLEKLSINEYLETKYDTDIPLFRWDNYASIFLKKYKHLIEHNLFVTYKEGDKPDTDSLREEKAIDLLENLAYWTEDGIWIFNIDIDYFFYKHDDGYYQMYSDKFISSFFKIVNDKINRNEIQVVTIALSPECCGGWENSEKVCRIATKTLGISFKIPRCCS